ncbi:MAG: Bug family tripartite tricarboxylate transporter substrate binding protein [Burkholderiales bacterium]
MKFRCIFVLVGLFAGLIWQATGFAAQDYPNKPVRVLVATPARSTPDMVARLVTPGLSTIFGQQFIVDNRSGANGMLGTELAAKAKPDGYTLVMGTPSTLTIMRYVHKDVPYDALRDFAPIGLISVGPYLLVAHPSVAARTVGELIALAKTRPDKLTYGSGGNGSTNHLAMELFKRFAGVDIRHVPYKGDLPAITDVLGGHVNMSMLSIGPLLPYIKTDRLRVLAVTSIKRASQLPQVPTLDESGLKGFEAIAWFGMLAPARTPKPIVARLAEGLQKVMRQREVRAQFKGQSIEPADGNPVELEQLIRREIETYGKLAKSAHIKAE